MKRVVITGIGSVTGVANNVKDFTDALKNSRHGFGPIDTFDTSKYQFHLGSNVKDIDSVLASTDRHYPRPIKFLLKATQEASEQSGILSKVKPTRIGTYLAGPACSLFEVENFYRDYVQKGLTSTKRSDLVYANYDSTGNEIARRFDLQGPRNTILTACSSSGVALGLAADLIRLGEVDAMVAGGTDGFSEFTFSGFQSLQSISPDPCRPFDRDRKGLSFGEGAGVLILEDYEFAKKRGAPILAELASYGAIGEGYNLTGPHPDAVGYIKTMRRALLQARMHADEISYVNAHGTATPANDAVEGRAIREVFRNISMPVNSIKSLVGHCMGAAGAVEAVNSVISIVENFIPGTLNFENPDPEIPIDVVRETRAQRVNAVLCNSAGFGGNNSSVLFRRV